MSEAGDIMVSVNMLEAKTNLSKLVEAVESGCEDEIVIARNGRPAARLVPLARSHTPKLIGAAKGQFSFDKAMFDALDDEVADLFAIPPMGEVPGDEAAA